MKRGLFITGAILTVIGAGISTFATFFLSFYFLPVWIFLSGVILVWVSERSVWTKVFWSLAPVIVFGLYQFLWYQFSKAPPETFLIPENYRGKIHVNFNEPCGQKAATENGRRLYTIPESGILLSQFTDKQGFIDQQYFLVNHNGSRTLLPQLDVHDYNEEWTIGKNLHEPSRDRLGVFHAGRVSGEGAYEFYVATYRQLSDSFNFQYDKRFDSLERSLLDTCR